MKERPILFSTPMVQGILENRKMMTRRIIKPQPLIDDNDQIGSSNGIPAINDYGSCSVIKCPYGKIGDVLWVRETFGYYLDAFLHKAGYDGVFKCVKWKPSIHMPKPFARIWLEIMSISPERLHDISREDCRKEGIEQIGATYRDYETKNSSTYNERRSFSSLWNKINGKGSWDANPWVWAISFKVLSTTGKPAGI